ncbi:Amino acid transporter [Caenorhabditis elegans]|uniref:Amino acid transporter n=1 Tax=Caenorhabditis elegans TaxID=6239 RepID=Q94197_CAEEL|nr:Amino acid transporter [Caenorhabditis elegans]CCD70188.1 Amino acid transporter [Caenorhabditis elegans]|eukprot:NP_500425.2 Amino Acid Transporter [Caenorhabditis elegans]
MPKKEDNKIGLIGATSYIVGSIIGSGIFIAPKGIVEHAGSVGLSLIIWVFCALLNMITAINYIELGTSIPESGADLAYIDYMGWTPIAFSLLWLSLLIQSSSSAAVLYLTFGKYLVQALEPIVCFTSSGADNCAKLFGFGLLLFLTLTNMFSLNKFAARVQIISMCSKIFATLIIIGIGFFFIIFRGATSHYRSSEIMKGSDWNAGAIALAIYQGNWAFGGFTTLNYGTEEIQIENFRKTLPRACLGGLLISAVIYVLVNVSYFAILTPQEIIDSSAVATTFIQRTVGNGPAFAVPAVVGFLLVGTLNGDVFGWSRYMVAGSRRKMMPTCFSLIHVDNDSPRVSVFFHTLTSIIFAFMGDTDQLVDYLTVTGMLTTIFALLVLVIIKWKKMPIASDPVKYSIFWPILNLVIMIALLVIPIQQDPLSSIIGFSMFLGGVVVYFIIKFVVSHTEFLGVIDEKLTHLCQILTWTIVDSGPEEKTRL